MCGQVLAMYVRLIPAAAKQAINFVSNHKHTISIGGSGVILLSRLVLESYTEQQHNECYLRRRHHPQSRRTDYDKMDSRRSGLFACGALGAYVTQGYSYYTHTTSNSTAACRLYDLILTGEPLRGIAVIRSEMRDLLLCSCRPINRIIARDNYAIIRTRTAQHEAGMAALCYGIRVVGKEIGTGIGGG